MWNFCAHTLGPVHAYPDIFKSATFSFQIVESPRPPISGYFWIGKFFFARTVLNIHGKELGSILWRQWIKKISGFSVHTFPDTLRIQKFLPPWRGIQKVADRFVCRIHRIRVYGSRNPERKSCALKNIRIRREGNWAELTFAKTTGTVTRDRGKTLANSWPARHQWQSQK